MGNSKWLVGGVCYCRSLYCWLLSKFRQKIKPIILIPISWIFIFANSCSLENKARYKREYYKSYVEYLSSVVNDTNFYDVPTLQIVDSSIYSILDSVIQLSERCKYFDPRIKYLYAFRFAARTENEKLLYFIDAHKSYACSIFNSRSL